MGYLKGQVFERMIEISNNRYKHTNKALVQKIATPIKPLKIDNRTRKITLAYFEEKSTVDFVGVSEGVPFCFDAKETAQKNLPLKNIHLHQIQYMHDFINNGGKAFLLVRFSKADEVYYLPFKMLFKAYNDSKAGGRQSIAYKDFKKEWKVENENGVLLHYLKFLR